MAYMVIYYKPKYSIRHQYDVVVLTSISNDPFEANKWFETKYIGQEVISITVHLTKSAANHYIFEDAQMIRFINYNTNILCKEEPLKVSR